MADDDGIKQIGPSLYHVRVKRIEKRTGRQVNRKATIQGTKADARKARDAIRAELDSTQTQRPRIRLSAFAASWLEQRASRLERSTIARYGHSLARILPVLGDIYLDALSPSDVRQYVADRIASGAEGHTVLNELRCLRTMAKDSVADGYVDHHWADRVQQPRVRHYTKERPNLFTPEQFELVFASIPERWHGLVLFIVTTGVRWGEASGLHWEDIRGNEVHITQVNDRGQLKSRTKTDKERTVPLLPEVAVLLGLRRNRGLVFPNRNGELHRGYPLIKVFTKACKLAGVPRVTAHGLRRTFNNLARQKTSREVLMSITGHVTERMVEHYSHVGHGEKVSAARAVARSIGVVRSA